MNTAINHAAEFEFAIGVAHWMFAVLAVCIAALIAAYLLKGLVSSIVEFVASEIRWIRGRKTAKIIGFKVDVEDYKKRRYGNGKH